MIQSTSKGFSMDEDHGISGSMKRPSYLRLLIKGAPGQSSPAPLDYIVNKFLYTIREDVNYFNLEPKVYFRLFALSISLLSGLFVLFMFTKGVCKNDSDLWIKAIQMVLVFFAFVAFLFSRKIYNYASIMRPYALWNSMWMVALSLALFEKNKKLLIAALLLLAFSATASIFQILILALSYFVIELLNKNSFKDSLLKCIKIFLIPFIISFYYCLLAGQWNWPWDEAYWGRFVKLWVENIRTIPLMVFAILLCFLRKENKKYAVTPLAALVLFLVGPILFFIIKFKGFFYEPRQFIYYDLTLSIFFLTLVKCLPAYLVNIKNKIVVIVIFGFILISCDYITFNKETGHRFYESMRRSFQISSYLSALTLHHIDTLYGPWK